MMGVRSKKGFGFIEAIFGGVALPDPKASAVAQGRKLQGEVDIAGKQESSKYSKWITVHPAVGQSKVDQQVMVVDIQ